MMADLNAPQPAPVPGGVPVWPLVIADMTDRDHAGRLKYGTPLTTGNGRDALVDAYQESLDLAVYLRQAIAEREAATAGEARVKELEEEVAALRRQVAGHCERIAAASEVLSRVAEKKGRVRVIYRGHGGVISWRTVSVLSVRVGVAPPRNPKLGLLLDVWEVGEQAVRTLALGDCLGWEPDDGPASAAEEQR